MSDQAHITITSGPDRGTVYQLDEEMVHVGRGADNHIELSDPTIAEYHLSIVKRNGRFALYAALPDAVYVDGETIPAEQWVWLPEVARVRVGERTSFQLNQNAGPASQAAGSPKASHTAGAKQDAPARARPRPTKKKGRKRAAGNQRQVARFITDRGGDAMVQLGEDGQLPELSLAEGPKADSLDKRRSSNSNPLLVYAAVGLSFVLSISMLLIESSDSSTSAQQRARARRELMDYFGRQGQAIQPYQRLLREAHLAHTRNDRPAERRALRGVLRYLNAEDNTSTFSGLTGDRKRDERLRELIAIVLSE